MMVYSRLLGMKFYFFLLSMNFLILRVKAGFNIIPVDVDGLTDSLFLELALLFYYG